ncbi:MAG: glycerol-3-phosphate dehydrogenase, partial [Gemmatimonadota bacterium]
MKDSSRRSTLARLMADPVDLLVIGGGITGAGIARDAAMRGISVILVDQHDLASGTSSRSSRLVHGGLRYLEQRQFRLVSEAARERATLLAIAPHLVWPLEFVFPIHRGDRVPLWQLAAGVWLYDLLALFRKVRRHRVLGKRAMLEAEPMLRERGLAGGARYADAQCDDARLTIATARSAAHHGAMVANYMAVRGLRVQDGRIDGAALEDRLTGEQGAVRASLVVNASGPWVDRVRRLEDPNAAPMLRPTRGVHLVVPRERIGNRNAITFLSPIDGRVMFVLPWGDLSYIGTTDTDAPESPDTVTVTPDDIVYLLRSVNARFPGAHLVSEDIISSWAGLRPLVRDDAHSASGTSREHVIVQGPAGLVSVAGGKLTTYRSMAAEVVDRVAKLLPSRRRGGWPGTAATALEPLPGGEAADLGPFRERALSIGLSPATADHLTRQYGTESAGILNLGMTDRALLEPLHPRHPALAGEV